MNSNSRAVKNKFQAMGTDVSVEIVLDEPAEAGKAGRAIKETKKIFEENEKIFSRFRKDSELSKINKSLGKEIEMSGKMFEVLALCLKFNEISGGYFDPRIIENLEHIGYDKNFGSNNFNIPESKKAEIEELKGSLKDDLILNSERRTILAKRRIDTTGIVKGYTVDEVARYLSGRGFSAKGGLASGWQNFIVDAGGDMFARGLNKNGENWQIAVEGLDSNDIKLTLHNEGAATSGISRKFWAIGDKKFHHLINPKNPQNFSFNLKTVIVIADKTVEADGRAKILVLMGKAKGLKFANHNNIKALFLDDKNNIYLSEAMKEKVVKRS